MKPTDALVQMLASPITTVDLAQIAGSASYPSGAASGSAPAGGRVCGNEGVGIVEGVGAGAGLAVGDFVVASQPGLGEAKRASCPPPSLRAVVLFPAPTARCMGCRGCACRDAPTSRFQAACSAIS